MKVEQSVKFREWKKVYRSMKAEMWIKVEHWLKLREQIESCTVNGKLNSEWEWTGNEEWTGNGRLTGD